MRIATAQTFAAGIDNLQRRQIDMATAQQQLTNGKRVQRASDDPTAAARSERALASMARADTSQRGLEASRNAMTLTEGALSDANDLMQQAREAMVSAGNASYSDAERKSLAQQLQSIRTQLLSVANRTDGAGGYVFAGQGTSQQPFVDAPGGVQFRGVGGQVQVAGDEPLPLSVDGGAAWMNARSGNGVFETSATSGTTGAWIDNGRVTDPSQITGSTYTVQFASGAGGTTYSVLKDGAPTALVNATFASGQAIEIDGMSFTVSGSPTASDGFQIKPSTPSLSVFSALDSAIGELNTGQRSSAQLAQTAQTGLRNIDAAMGRLQTLRSDVGETLNRTDGVENRIGASKLASQTERSNAEDLDMAQAISEFQNQQSGYDAALKTYSMVQRMSLFQYIGG